MSVVSTSVGIGISKMTLSSEIMVCVKILTSKIWNTPSTCAVVFRTLYGGNRTHRFDTQGFVPVASLCGKIGSP